MKETFKSQQKQSKIPVEAAGTTTFVPSEWPTNPPLSAGPPAPILKNPQQSTSTASSQAIASDPPTNPAGFGSLAVVKQIRIRAPSNIDGFGPPSDDPKWLAHPQSWFRTLFMFLHSIIHFPFTIHQFWGPFTTFSDFQLISGSSGTLSFFAASQWPLIGFTFSDSFLFSPCHAIKSTCLVVWNFFAACVMSYWQHCFLLWVVHGMLCTYLLYGLMTPCLLRILLSTCAFHLCGSFPRCSPQLVGNNLPYKHLRWHLRSAFPATWMLLHAVMLSASMVAYTQLGLCCYPVLSTLYWFYLFCPHNLPRMPLQPPQPQLQPFHFSLPVDFHWRLFKAGLIHFGSENESTPLSSVIIHLQVSPMSLMPLCCNVLWKIYSI